MPGGRCPEPTVPQFPRGARGLKQNQELTQHRGGDPSLPRSPPRPCRPSSSASRWLGPGSVPARSRRRRRRVGGTRGRRASPAQLRGGGRGSPPTPNPPRSLPSLPAALLISNPKGAPGPPRPPVNPWGPGAPPVGGGGWLAASWGGRGCCKATSEPTRDPLSPSGRGEGAAGPPCRVPSRAGTPPPCWASPRAGTPQGGLCFIIGVFWGGLGGRSGGCWVGGGHSAPLGAMGPAARS